MPCYCLYWWSRGDRTPDLMTAGHFLSAFLSFVQALVIGFVCLLLSRCQSEFRPDRTRSAQLSHHSHTVTCNAAHRMSFQSLTEHVHVNPELDD